MTTAALNDMIARDFQDYAACHVTRPPEPASPWKPTAPSSAPALAEPSPVRTGRPRRPGRLPPCQRPPWPPNPQGAYELHPPQLPQPPPPRSAPHPHGNSQVRQPLLTSSTELRDSAGILAATATVTYAMPSTRSRHGLPDSIRPARDREDALRKVSNQRWIREGTFPGVTSHGTVAGPSSSHTFRCGHRERAERPGWHDMWVRDRLPEEGPNLGRGTAAVHRHRRTHRERPGRRVPRLGHQPGTGLIDRRLYLPQQSRYTDPDRRNAAGRPETEQFATNPVRTRANASATHLCVI